MSILLQPISRIRDIIRLPAIAKAEYLRDCLGLSEKDPGIERVVDEGIAWICRAQDHSASHDGGITRHFSLVTGCGRLKIGNFNRGFKTDRIKKEESMQKGFTLWLTGLSGAGKTTIANRTADILRERGIQGLEILDGDLVRTNLSKGLGFSREDRNTNIQRITFVADLLTRNDIVTIVAAISPYRESREYARKQIKNLIEVFVKCPLDVLTKRDVKGLYIKALKGEISNFTGVSDPYEEPLNPEVSVETDKETPEESVRKIIEKLEALGYVEKEAERISSEEAVVNYRLGTLGQL